MNGSERDIVAGLEHLIAVPGDDPARIGVVGASYTGELAVVAGLLTATPRVTALLSPGSLSLESVRRLDRLGRPWLFASSRAERSQATREVIALVHDSAGLADVVLMVGSAHGTDLLSRAAGFDRILADWLAPHLALASPRSNAR